MQAHKSPGSDNSDTLTYGSFTSQNEAGLKEDNTLVEEKGQQTDKQKVVSDFLEKYILGRFQFSCSY